MKCVLVCWEGKRDGDGEGGRAAEREQSRPRVRSSDIRTDLRDGRRRRRDIRCILARGFLVRPPVDVGDATAAGTGGGAAWRGRVGLEAEEKSALA